MLSTYIQLMFIQLTTLTTYILATGHFSQLANTTSKNAVKIAHLTHFRLQLTVIRYQSCS